MEYVAHKRETDGAEQTVKAHLNGAAERSKAFAAEFGCGELGRAVALLHDVGKYSPAFQRRIRGENLSVDHSTAGAKEAAQKLKNIAASLAIAGHHGGMPDLGSKFDTEADVTLFGRLKRQLEDYSACFGEIDRINATAPEWAGANYINVFFFTHMLFSCLVDADYLDTESFLREGTVRRGGYASVAELHAKVNAHIAKWQDPKGDLNKRRTAILNAVREKGRTVERGLFTLTVPTGGGKTVTSAAFALEHAVKRHLRRMIYVIPYTSIIEQTQDVFNGIFGEQNVIAHYASVAYNTDESGNINDVRKLAAENWDAPIIITTNVQFFESLYSNKPGKCRKLHNIANSVIVFDEAQMIPTAWLYPCMAAVSQLTRYYGCTCVLCTATQPALDGIIKRQDIWPEAKLTELCPEPQQMYKAFRRVRYTRIGKCSDEKLCALMKAQARALMIVNTRRQAQELYKAIRGEGNVFHLSTTMCPVHRREVLAEIKERLREGKPCRVISTSLVEAGVDVDFPVVYRAAAGLDSVIQAGGRCNREGKAACGEVYVFDAEENTPVSMKKSISVFERTAEKHDDIASPQAIEDYFAFLYYLGGSDALDKKSIMREISCDRMEYRSIAEKFNLIDNEDRTVYVPYAAGKELVQSILTNPNPTRAMLRRLDGYGVSVRKNTFDALYASGATSLLGENAAVLGKEELYDLHMGLPLEAPGGCAEFV